LVCRVGEGEDVDEEDWMVPHGYLSDDEGAQDEEDGHAGAESNVDRKERKKQLEENSASKRGTAERAYSIGCMWGEEALQHSKLGMYAVEALLPTPIAVFEEPSQPDKKRKKGDSKGKPKTELEAAGYPDLVRLAHGSIHGIEKVATDFQQMHPGYTKASIIRALKDKEFCVREIRHPYKKMRRFVLPKVLGTYNLSDLVLPTPEPVREKAAPSSKNAIMNALKQQATVLPTKAPSPIRAKEPKTAAKTTPSAKKSASNSILKALQKQGTQSSVAPAPAPGPLARPALGALTNTGAAASPTTKITPRPVLPPAPSALA